MSLSSTRFDRSIGAAISQDATPPERRCQSGDGARVVRNHRGAHITTPSLTQPSATTGAITAALAVIR